MATKNHGKFLEISEALKTLNGCLFKLVFLRDVSVIYGDFVEDGETFAENAFKKASYYFGKTGILTLAEDSGIIVDALRDELGVKTRRWGAGESASDEEWLEYFMSRMSGVVDRGAKFVCSACVCGEEIREGFEGETYGKITEKIMVPILKGLPLSSCFLPDGRDKVYAALSSEEKNKISHRGKAMVAVLKFLGELKE